VVDSRPTVVVFDYGSGNVHSAVKALEKAGARVTLTSDRSACLEADGLVVPGVGAFHTVMAALIHKSGPEIIDKRLAGGKAVLGICVGLQVMFDHGVEHDLDTQGLGQWPGTVTKLAAPRLPHMGWNTVEVASGSQLFDGVESERFYFVHSYAATSWKLQPGPAFSEPKVTWSTHGERFVAAVENGPLTATQFHPEKSGEAGLRLLTNWVASL
jgi:glutamine amidotransferase